MPGYTNTSRSIEAIRCDVCAADALVGKRRYHSIRLKMLAVLESAGCRFSSSNIPKRQAHSSPEFAACGCFGGLESWWHRVLSSKTLNSSPASLDRSGTDANARNIREQR